jgi:hypothetical protein
VQQSRLVTELGQLRWGRRAKVRPKKVQVSCDPRRPETMIAKPGPDAAALARLQIIGKTGDTRPPGQSSDDRELTLYAPPPDRSRKGHGADHGWRPSDPSKRGDRDGADRAHPARVCASRQPLFRPLKHNGKRQDERRSMDPDAIDRVVRKYSDELGLDRGYSAHSCRRPPGTGTRARPSCMIGVDITRKRRLAFSQRINIVGQKLAAELIHGMVQPVNSAGT